MKIFAILIPVITFILFTSCNKKNQSSEAEEFMGHDAWQKHPEHIPGIEFESILTPKLDANDNPAEEITYTHVKAGNFFVHTRFHHIPNGKHWYVCNMSTKDQKNVYMGSRFDFQVTNNSYYVWTELMPSLFYGLKDDLIQGNEIFVELYIDGKLFNRIPMRLLSQAELESGNFRKYWEEANFFEQYESLDYRVDEFRTSYLRFKPEWEVAKIFPVVYKGFNRFFIIHRESKSNSNFSFSEIQKNGNLRNYGVLPTNEDYKLHFTSTVMDNRLILENLFYDLKITLDLEKNSYETLGSFDKVKEKSYSFSSPDNEFQILNQNTKLIVLKNGEEYDQKKINEPEELTIDAVSWSRDGQYAYVSFFGHGIHRYNIISKELNKVIFDPSASAPHVFYNDNSELIAYITKKNELKIASLKAGSYFQPQIDYNHTKHLSMITYFNSKDTEINYFENPKLVVNNSTSFEMEMYSTIVYAFGTVSGDRYNNDTLIKLCYEEYYEDKTPVYSFSDEQCELFIVKNDSLLYLSRHGKSFPDSFDEKYFFQTGDYAFYIKDPGYSFEKLDYLKKRTKIFEESGILLDGFIQPDELVLAGNKMKRLGEFTATQNSPIEFVELLKHEEYGSIKIRKKDDGTFNLVNPDGTVQIYTYDFPEESTSEDGGKSDFRQQYLPYLQRNCWGGTDVLASIITDVDKEEIKSTDMKYMGKDLYEFVSDNNELLNTKYESYVNWMGEKEALSFAEYKNDKPILLWEDGLGRYVAFSKVSYLEPMNCEPMIYAYSDQRRQVQFSFDSSIQIMASNPHSSDGWNISVRDDSLLYLPANNKTYHRLFWEGKSGQIAPLEKGYVIQTDSLESFLSNQLVYRGLNSKETSEFIEAWKADLSEKSFCFIGFYDQEQIEQYAPINISPKPDAFIRVLMDFKTLDNHRVVQMPALDTVKTRPEYTVVEWGGIKR